MKPMEYGNMIDEIERLRKQLKMKSVLIAIFLAVLCMFCTWVAFQGACLESAAPANLSSIDAPSVTLPR